MTGRARGIAASLLLGAGAALCLAAAPIPQLLGLPLVVAGLFWALVPRPAALVRLGEAITARPALSWGLPLLGLALLVGVAYHPLLAGHMPWAVGQADHPTHQYQAWLLVERMLPTGRLSGWSDLRWAGYPALELYPIGGPLWVALFRGLTLGALDWEATYALALYGMLTANVAAVYVTTRRLSDQRLAAVVAALLVLFERGWPRQGGDHYAIDVGVWPVTMGVGPLLLCLELQWSWLVGRVCPRALGAACLLAGWALLCHPMYLPVLILALPCTLTAAIAQGQRSDRAALAAVLPLLLGLMLAAFWYLPFLTQGELSEPGGAPFRSLSNLGESLAMVTLVPRFWEPALVLAVVGAALALARGGGLAAIALLSLVLVLASASTPLELSRRLTGLSASVQQERFLIPLRVLLTVLAGSAVAELVKLGARSALSWGLRQRLAGAAVLLLATPLLAPALEGLVKQLVVPITEFDQGSDGDHRGDLLAMCRWLRGQVGDQEPPPRTAWYVGFGHHEYNNAPIYCGLAQIIETPAETIASRPGGISEREVRAFNVRWVIGDRPIPGRDDYLRLRRRFGALHVYEVLGYQPQRLTVLGPGRATLERFEDEYLRARLEGGDETTRLVFHVTRTNTWRATVDGNPVPTAAGHLGLPRASLIHLRASQGVVELRYERGLAYKGGALASLVAALLIGLLGLLGAAPALRERLTRARWLRPISSLPRPVRALALCLTAILVLALLTLGSGGAQERAQSSRGTAVGVRPGEAALSDHLAAASVWIIERDAETGQRRRRVLSRRWDGRFGDHFPPEVLVDRHVEALDLGDPRRVIAARVSGDDELHLRFPLQAIRGIRGALARGGSGRSPTIIEVWLGHRRLEVIRQDQLGQWLAFEASTEAAAGPLELVIRTEGPPGRAVLIDAALVE